MKYVAFALTAIAVSSVATATVINIDFNSSAPNSENYSGIAGYLADPGGASAYWNPGTYATGSGNSLVLADLNTSQNVSTAAGGSGTGVGFRIDGLTATGTDGGAITTPNGEQERSGGYVNLMKDYLRIDSGSSSAVATATGKFTGLVTGATYDLYFYAQGQYFTALGGSANVYRGQNSLFQISPDNWAQTGYDGIPGGDGELVPGEEFVKLRAVAVAGDNGGEITFTWQNVVYGVNIGVEDPDDEDAAPSPATTGTRASRYGALNGIQLVAVVPEPSTALLGMLGTVGLLLRRRR